MNTRPVTIVLGLVILASLAAGAYFLGTQQAQLLPSPSPMPAGVVPPPSPAPGQGPVVSESENIKVAEPAPLVRVSSPFILQGEARVFENTVNYRLSEPDGTILAEGFTTAEAPDIGQFGPFQAEVSFTRPTSDTGVLEVFSISARDGSEIDKVTIPLVFRLEES